MPALFDASDSARKLIDADMGKLTLSGTRLGFLERHPASPGRAVVLRIEPPTASRPYGFHR